MNLTAMGKRIAIAVEPASGPPHRRYVEHNGENDMSDTTQEKTSGLLKNKPLLFLIGAFVLLIAIGVATS